MCIDLPQTHREHGTEVAALRARIVELEAEQTANGLCRGVMHEVSNLLTVLTLGLPELMDAARKGAGRKAQDRCDLLSDVTESLTELLWLRSAVQPAADNHQVTRSTLHRMVPGVLRLLRENARGVAVLAEELQEVPDVAIPAGAAVQVLLNLVNNSVDSLRESGRKDGVITVRLTSAADFVRLDVIDNGTGIPSHQLDQIFDPGFTTKERVGGMGVGLSVCHTIVSNAGGFIRASSRDGQGATMSVLLPAAK